MTLKPLGCCQQTSARWQVPPRSDTMEVCIYTWIWNKEVAHKEKKKSYVVWNFSACPELLLAIKSKYLGCYPAGSNHFPPPPSSPSLRPSARPQKFAGVSSICHSLRQNRESRPPPPASPASCAAPLIARRKLASAVKVWNDISDGGIISGRWKLISMWPVNVQVLVGVSARLAANGVFRPFGPLYIPFGEQGHSCIKGCLVRVAAQVSLLRIVSQLDIKGNSAIYFTPF